MCPIPSSKLIGQRLSVDAVVGCLGFYLRKGKRREKIPKSTNGRRDLHSKRCRVDPCFETRDRSRGVHLRMLPFSNCLSVIGCFHLPRNGPEVHSGTSRSCVASASRLDPQLHLCSIILLVDDDRSVTLAPLIQRVQTCCHPVYKIILSHKSR